MPNLIYKFRDFFIYDKHDAYRKASYIFTYPVAALLTAKQLQNGLLLFTKVDLQRALFAGIQP
ncbi:hypothetical protein M2404_003697 [Rheinheimera pacifica]|nr:hypothetical protein [Rheinheimera pacifica]